MTVLVLEDNLLWSARVASACRGLGHEATVLDRLVEALPRADVAVVGLDARAFDPLAAVGRLREAGAYVIVHTGHKEAAKLEAGRTAGADRVATNGEVAKRLGALLAEASRRSAGA